MWHNIGPSLFYYQSSDLTNWGHALGVEFEGTIIDDGYLSSNLSPSKSRLFKYNIMALTKAIINEFTMIFFVTLPNKNTCNYKHEIKQLNKFIQAFAYPIIVLASSSGMTLLWDTLKTNVNIHLMYYIGRREYWYRTINTQISVVIPNQFFFPFSPLSIPINDSSEDVASTDMLHVYWHRLLVIRRW